MLSSFPGQCLLHPRLSCPSRGRRMTWSDGSELVFRVCCISLLKDSICICIGREILLPHCQTLVSPFPFLHQEIMYFPFPSSMILCFSPSSIWNLKGKLFCRVGWTLDFGQIPRNSHQHIGPRLILWHTHWLRGSHASSRQAQGRNLENGAETETAEELCLLTCFSWFTQPAFLYSSGLYRSHDSR